LFDEAWILGEKSERERSKRLVEALEKIANHWVDYELGEMSHEGQTARQALKEYEQ